MWGHWVLLGCWAAGLLGCWAARDSGLGTRDSGLGTRDSGPGTRDPGPGTRKSIARPVLRNLELSG
ncbi:MAG: hypothetical protein CVV16_15400 [Gammaproteobacteria bacterium HGW-Gammaproteobacteria-6]|nr:MAG: hypothetical protein CVV16_15400 [Gammaproteobacteria bacterium HGW-Gammaproteobacteria-6]